MIKKIFYTTSLFFSVLSTLAFLLYCIVMVYTSVVPWNDYSFIFIPYLIVYGGYIIPLMISISMGFYVNTTRVFKGLKAIY